VRYFNSAVAVVAVSGFLAVGAATAASATSKPDVTPPCGASCITISSAQYGPNFVLNANSGGGARLRSLGNSYSHEDFIVDWYGTVRDAAHDGLISRKSFAYINYRNYDAYELALAPYGVTTGLCEGVASASFNGEAVTARPCGASAKTLWILDAAYATGPYVPAINGSDANFSTPKALTATGQTSKLIVNRLQTYSAPAAADNQLFTEVTGVTTP
jgi:hypothetical protein